MGIADKFSKKFGSHWIKVKFYRQPPLDHELTQPRKMNFCQATKQALISPILLNNDNLDCLGAKYVFGWYKNHDKIIQNCYLNSDMDKQSLKKLFKDVDYLRQPFYGIGINVEDAPDVLLSYLSPRQISSLVKTYQKYRARNIEVSLSSLMTICGGLVVKSYNTHQLTLSFASSQSRKCANLSSDFLAAAVPSNLFELFLN